MRYGAPGFGKRHTKSSKQSVSLRQPRMQYEVWPWIETQCSRGVQLSSLAQSALQIPSMFCLFGLSRRQMPPSHTADSSPV